MKLNNINIVLFHKNCPPTHPPNPSACAHIRTHTHTHTGLLRQVKEAQPFCLCVCVGVVEQVYACAR